MYNSTSKEIWSVHGLVWLLTMTVGNLLHHDLPSTPASCHKFHKNTYPHHLMDKVPKACSSMTPYTKKPKTKSWQKQLLYQTVHELQELQLVWPKNLRNLWQWIQTIELTLQKQWMWTWSEPEEASIGGKTAYQPGHQTISVNESPSPEIKKSCNNETPTIHTNAKALFTTPKSATPERANTSHPHNYDTNRNKW